MISTDRLECARLADQLERAFRGGAWHGPALREVLAGVDAATAAWRPAPGSHGIAGLVHHLTYWMQETSHRLGRGPAPEGPDWWEGESLSEAAWADRLAELEEAHRALHGAVLALEDGRLEEVVPGADPTVRGLLLGTLQHTAYHGGQMALVRKLAEARP
jgi:hypothetical protein